MTSFQTIKCQSFLFHCGLLYLVGNAKDMLIKCLENTQKCFANAHQMFITCLWNAQVLSQCSSSAQPVLSKCSTSANKCSASAQQIFSKCSVHPWQMLWKCLVNAQQMFWKSSEDQLVKNPYFFVIDLYLSLSFVVNHYGNILYQVFVFFMFYDFCKTNDQCWDTCKDASNSKYNWIE